MGLHSFPQFPLSCAHLHLPFHFRQAGVDGDGYSVGGRVGDLTKYQ